MSLNFKMKGISKASYVLGVKIIKDHSRRLLNLSQEIYIKKVLEQFRIHHCKPVNTQEMIRLGEVTLRHNSTTRMVANPLTKPIARNMFKTYVMSLGVRKFVCINIIDASVSYAFLVELCFPI